jgi:cytidylate kinase
LSQHQKGVVLSPKSIQKAQIGIAGWGGSGTSSAAKGVCALLPGAWHIKRPASDEFRRLAAEKYPEEKDALSRFAEDAKTDLEIDRRCDQAALALCESSERFILDARLSGMVMSEGLRVLLVCVSNIRYRRIADREGESLILSLSNREIAREQSDALRYQELYGFSRLEVAADKFGGYHLIINTEVVCEDDVVDLITKAFYQCSTM